jgi:hypothetical protein
MEKAVIKILSLLLVSLGFTGCVSVTLPVVAVPHIRGQVVAGNSSPSAITRNATFSA